MLLDEKGNSRSQDEIMQSILDMWKQTGVEACELGTEMHNTIELYYNDHDDIKLETKELKMFLQFDKYAQTRGLLPYRTEWLVFDEHEHICGAVDFVMKSSIAGSYHIFDWKRSKKISKTGSRMKYCLQHLRDGNFYKYALQLNIYKYIIQKNYGITISSLALVVLHPDQDTYLLYNLPDLQTEVKNMLLHYKTKQDPIFVSSIFPLVQTDTEICVNTIFPCL